MTSTDAIAAKNAFVLITNKFVIKQMRSLRRLRPCLSWNSKHWSNYFAGRGPTTVRGYCYMSLFLLILSLTAWIAANVYAYVHGHTRTHWPQSTQSTRKRISSKTLSTSSLTINAPLIVKDEVDKVFELILFRNKKKCWLCGLRLIVVWDPPMSRGPWRAPGQVGPWLLF